MIGKKLTHVFLVAIALLEIYNVSYAQDEFEQARQALEAQLPGKLLHNPYQIDWRANGSDVSGTVVKSAGVPGDVAYRVKVKKKQTNPWKANLRLPLDTDIKKGDKIGAYFWVKTDKGVKGTDQGDIDVLLGRTDAPYDVVFSKKIQPTQEWRLVEVEGVAKADFATSETAFGFNLGRDRQTISFGQFYIMRLGENAASAVNTAPARNEASVVSGNDFKLALVGQGGVSKTISTSEAQGGKALEVTVTDAEEVNWKTFVSAPVQGAISSGDTLEFTFWARALGASGKLTAVVKQNSPPYKNALFKPLDIDAHWKQYTVRSASKIDISNGDAALSFMIGDRPQTLQFGAYKVTNLGQ